MHEDEVGLFLDQPVALQVIASALQHLERRKLVAHLNGFWGFPTLSHKVELRQSRSEHAKERKPAAIKYSKVVATFPFVRAVFLTGSFSKGVMYQDSDIDFFIIIDPGKLWFTKALMVIFRKIFLFNSHRNFCINYLVTSDHLMINERNIFTATELVTMMPIFGYDLYQEMIQKNQWVTEYFPTYSKWKDYKNRPQIVPYQLIKGFFETLFDYNWATKIGDRFMYLSKNKYRNKYHKGLNEAEFNTAIVTTRQVSKVHPQFFQKRIVEEYSEKCERFFKSIEILDCQ